MPRQQMWAITDSQSRKGASLGIKLMNGGVHKADSVREMAYVMKVNPDILKSTLDLYNRFAVLKEDPLFIEIEYYSLPFILALRDFVCIFVAAVFISMDKPRFLT